MYKFYLNFLFLSFLGTTLFFSSHAFYTFHPIDACKRQPRDSDKAAICMYFLSFKLNL